MAKTQPVDPWNRARLHLRRRDEVLRPIITHVGPCTLRPQTDLFALLVFAIVSQQISRKAAQSINARLIAGPCRGVLSAQAILASSEEELRGAGLSTAKRLSLLDLSRRVAGGELRLDELPNLPDDEVIAQLVPVRGIGVWTAQMFLIFSLGRPDVLPVDDFGLKAALRRHYNLSDLPDRKTIEARAEPWQPFRSIATWYLWRSLDT
jgi:DNA-3-methyladenine glycosylase II